MFFEPIPEIYKSGEWKYLSFDQAGHLQVAEKQL